MIGQRHLFPPTGTKLRQRVTVELTATAPVNALMLDRHYLHRKRVRPGAAYVILLDGETVGAALIAYPFCPAKTIGGVLRLECIELARFWLSENVPNLASAALGQIIRRVADDWHQKYPHLPKPTALVSWADLEAGHEGVIYRAAGAQEQGVGGGNDHHAARTLNRKRHRDYQHKKRRFMWHLVGSAS